MEKFIKWLDRAMIRRLTDMIALEQEAVYRDIYRNSLNELYTKYSRTF
ncbi:hypothetical protein [Paenibacillus bovis]|nr:hypothetical protein [Paenibacillus bovis]